MIRVVTIFDWATKRRLWRPVAVFLQTTIKSLLDMMNPVGQPVSALHQNARPVLSCFRFGERNRADCCDCRPNQLARPEIYSTNSQ